MKKIGKQIPLEIVEKWLKDEDWRVRSAAMNACASEQYKEGEKALMRLTEGAE